MAGILTGSLSYWIGTKVAVATGKNYHIITIIKFRLALFDLLHKYLNHDYMPCWQTYWGNFIVAAQDYRH